MAISVIILALGGLLGLGILIVGVVLVVWAITNDRKR
jgi:hypothetical protein